MPRDGGQKMKLHVLYELLSKHTDENNPISTKALRALLKEQGIIVSGRALFQDVLLLNEYNYEVNYFRKRSYHYFIADRIFDIPELKVLIDAVNAANFIPEDKTLTLVEKIASLAGIHRAELLKKNIICFDTNKRNNRQIFYIIDTLETAIEEGKKASFLYFDFDMHKRRIYRKDGQRYTVNPLALIFTNDKYYLVCYSDKYRNITNYRVDRMEKVEVEKELVTPVKEFENFNIHKYKQEAFSMHSGELCEVDLLVDAGLIDAILDRFGEDTLIFPAENNKFRVRVPVRLSPMFYGWCLMSQGKISIESPAEVMMELYKYKKAITEGL